MLQRLEEACRPDSKLRFLAGARACRPDTAAKHLMDSVKIVAGNVLYFLLNTFRKHVDNRPGRHGHSPVGHARLGTLARS